MKLIAKALIEAQKEMDNAVKDSKNPFFRSKYADLNSVREACIPALNKYSVVVLQPICQVDGKSYVKTLLLHESGESIESLTEIVYGKQGDAQAQGSGITYARRYGLQSLVCIGAEDDDGNKASVAEVPIEEEWQDSKEGKKWIADNFKIIKEAVEACESAEELKTLWQKTKAVDISRLKRFSKKHFDLLEESKEFMKNAFDVEKELQPPA